MDKKILIIEDDPILSKTLVEKFAEMGFRVSQAYDGEEGLKKLTKERPDLTILDIAMPKMDGLTLLRTLRGYSWGEKLPVIFLTNLETNEEIIQNIIKSEPMQYLQKSKVNPSDVVRIAKERLIELEDRKILEARGE